MQYQLKCAIQSLKILENVLNDFIDYAQMLSQQLYVENSEFNLINLINEVIDLISYQIDLKKLKLKKNLSTNLPITIQSDRK